MSISQFKAIYIHLVKTIIIKIKKTTGIFERYHILPWAAECVFRSYCYFENCEIWVLSYSLYFTSIWKIELACNSIIFLKWQFQTFTTYGLKFSSFCLLFCWLNFIGSMKVINFSRIYITYTPYSTINDDVIYRKIFWISL